VLAGCDSFLTETETILYAVQQVYPVLFVMDYKPSWK
jgi:hypothetical protein